jgi:Natural resistance-associated macrophage protein
MIRLSFPIARSGETDYFDDAITILIKSEFASRIGTLFFEFNQRENQMDSASLDNADNNGMLVAPFNPELNPFKRFLKILGPGLVTGASDDDPSGISTYAMAGASLGYATLWTALVTFPLMAAVQFISAKIGLVSGRGIAELIRRHYSRFLLYPVVLSLVVANIINAAADIGLSLRVLTCSSPSPSFP